MNFSNLIENIGKSRKIEKSIYITSFIFLLILCLGKFHRYFISEQLSLAINLEETNSIYPNEDLSMANHSSSYFPGMVYLIYFLRTFVPDIALYEVMLFIAALSIIFFFYVLRKISIEIFDKIELENFWLFSIIFCLWMCDFWLYYATSFKTDIFAFSLILYAFLIAKPHVQNVKRNYLQIFISLILIAYAITLKQQAILILGAVLIYSIINKNLFFKIYSSLIFLISFLLFYFFYLDENLWFHTFEKYKGDDFYTISELIKLYYNDVINFLLLLLFVALSKYFRIMKLDLKNDTQIIYNNLKKNIWVYLTFAFASAGFISSLKIGGNSGNIQISIILFLPFIYIFLRRFNKQTMIIVAFALLFLKIPDIIHNFKNYYYSKDFQFNVKTSLKNSQKVKILSDKYTYFSVFLVEEDNQTTDFETLRVIEKYLNNRKLSKVELLNEVLKKDFDFIIFSDDISKIEQIKNNYKLLLNSKKGYVYQKI